jgi:hypothetical protein
MADGSLMPTELIERLDSDPTSCPNTQWCQQLDNNRLYSFNPNNGWTDITESGTTDNAGCNTDAIKQQLAAQLKSCPASKGTNAVYANILNDVQNLQGLEQALFKQLNNQLVTSSGQTTQQDQDLVQRINDISTMRIGLLRQLGHIEKTAGIALDSTREALQRQVALSNVVEQELNRAKRNITSQQDNKNNAIRLIEVGTYQLQETQAYNQILAIVVVALVVIVIATLLNQYFILPGFIATPLISLVIFVAVLMVGYRIYDISRRSNQVWEQYNFSDPATSNADANRAMYVMPAGRQPVAPPTTPTVTASVQQMPAVTTQENGTVEAFSPGSSPGSPVVAERPTPWIGTPQIYSQAAQPSSRARDSYNSMKPHGVSMAF